VTQSGATFSQPITLTIYDAETGTQLATSTQTFNVPYRPSASPKCTGDNAGKWQTPSKECKNGIADNVTFNFLKVKLPKTVRYAISYNTSNYGPKPLHVSGPYDSLNVAVTGEPSVGTSTDKDIWKDGERSTHPDFLDATPMVQFKAGNAG
jgi:hypothetical protein